MFVILTCLTYFITKFLPKAQNKESMLRSSRPKVFLVKHVLKIWVKYKVALQLF